MKTALSQQFTYQLKKNKAAFWAVFRSRRRADELTGIQFVNYRNSWNADVEFDRNRFHVEKLTRRSIYLCTYIAGCKASLVMPLSQLIDVKEGYLEDEYAK